MSEDNHYKILDVPESASTDDIKKAYRKLSLKYHPDKNPGKPEVVDIFHKINNAYEVLGDPAKKNEYDMMRKNPFGNMMGGGGPAPGQGGPNMEDILASMFFGGMPGMPGMQGMPGNIHMMHGMPGMPGMFPPGANFQIFRNGVPVNIQQMQKPEPINKIIPINMEMVLNGGSIPVEIERWIIKNGNKVTETQTIYVTIMKGIDNNEMMVLENQGHVVNEQCKGDIKIFIRVENDTGFQRRGLDLIIEKKISLKEALCGFSFDLKYINGKAYTINNQSGNIIPFGHQKVIANMGLTRDGHTGNMVIVFQIELPLTLTPEQIIILTNVL